MPNWVFNTLVATGNETDLAELREALSKPFTTKYYSYDTNEYSDKEIQTPFSFWNILRPSDEILDEYFSPAEFGKMGKDNWYWWNVDNWGCKWDASDVEVTDNGDGYILYSFSTPWSPVPDLLVNHLFPKFPNLTFSYEFEEEQGWGGEISYANSKIVSQSEYDIPSSHEDYLERDRECICMYDDDQNYWYDDCPREVVGA